jgi:hypothetical protein
MTPDDLGGKLPVIVDICDGEPVPGGVGHLAQGIAQVLDSSILWTGHLMPYEKYMVKKIT